MDLTRIDGISAGAARHDPDRVGGRIWGRFPSERHFTSWLGLAPRHAVSGGQQLAGKRPARAGSDAHVERAAHGGDGADPVQVGAGGGAAPPQARHKGMKTAVFATARKLAVLVYRMLRFGQDYVDEGEAAYEAAPSPTDLGLPQNDS